MRTWLFKALILFAPSLYSQTPVLFLDGDVPWPWAVSVMKMDQDSLNSLQGQWQITEAFTPGAGENHILPKHFVSIEVVWDQTSQTQTATLYVYEYLVGQNGDVQVMTFGTVVHTGETDELKFTSECLKQGDVPSVFMIRMFSGKDPETEVVIQDPILTVLQEQQGAVQGHYHLEKLDETPVSVDGNLKSVCDKTLTSKPIDTDKKSSTD